MTLEIQNFYDFLPAREKREYLLKNKILSAILWLNKSKGIGHFQNKDILNITNKYLEIDTLKKTSERTLLRVIQNLCSIKINNHILLTKEAYTISKFHGGGGLVKYYPNPIAKDLLKSFFKEKVAIQKIEKWRSLKKRNLATPLYNSYNYSDSVSEKPKKEEVKQKLREPKENRAEQVTKKKEKSFIPYDQQYQKAKEELKVKGLKEYELEEIQKGIIQKAIKENILIYLNHFLKEIILIDKSFIQKAIRVFTKEIKKDFSNMSYFKKGATEFTRILNYFLREKQLKDKKEKEKREKAILIKEQEIQREREEKEFTNILKEKELQLNKEEKEYQDFLFEQALSFRKKQFPKYPISFLEKNLKEYALLKTLKESQSITVENQEIYLGIDSTLNEKVFSHLSFFTFKEGRQAI